MKYVGLLILQTLQSVDNEIALWEPKMKEQSPGEVRFLELLFHRHYFFCTSSNYPICTEEMVQVVS